MLTQLKQFYYFYETEVAEVINIKRNVVDDDTDAVRDTSLAYAEID
jgi:hypothetical protein